MAAGLASFTVLLCLICFSTLAIARTSPDLLPESNTIRQTSNDLLPESNTKSDAADTIVLPSEKVESDSVPVIESQSEISDSKVTEPIPEAETLKPIESSEDSDSIQIMEIDFRPINRHMPWRPMQFPSRPGHRCRHSHKFKPWNSRLPRYQISYGNDMFRSNDQQKDSDVLPDDRVPKIPMRWTRYGRFEPRFNDESNTERIKKMMGKRFRNHHERDHDDEHDHHHDHDKHEDDDDNDLDPYHKILRKRNHDRDHKHERQGGLMKKIRKFLQHF